MPVGDRVVSTTSRANLKPKTRKERSDKKPRVNPSLDLETHILLQKLAAVCRIGAGDSVTKTSIAACMLASCVRNAAFVSKLQDEFNVPLEQRLVFIRDYRGDISY